MEIADFNEDGKIDVAAGTDYGNVHIFLGHGDGSFASSCTYPLDSYVYWLEAMDFNHDGNTDLAGCTTSSVLEILLGNGDGSFRPVVQYPLGGGSYAAEAWHFDHDGNVDIAVGGSRAVSVFPGLGEDGFVSAPVYETGYGGSSVAFGHFNPGTIEDLVVTHYSISPEEDKVSLLLGNSDGTFQSPVTYDVGDDPLTVAVGRFNDDAHDDVVTVNWRGENVSILLGNGNGTLQSATTFPVCDSPTDVAVGAFNDDAFDDLVVSSRYGDAAFVLIGNGDGTFQTPVSYPVPGHAYGVDVGDLDDDTHLDFVVAVGTPGFAGVYFGNGDGTFNPGPNWPLPGGAMSMSVIDVDLDGAPDLVATGGGGVRVLMNSGDGTFPLTDVYAGWTSFDAVASGSFDDDRSIDIVAANADNGSITLLLGNGDGTFTEAGMYGVAAGPRSVISFDADDDGRDDVVAVNRYPGGATVLINISDETPVEGAFYALAADDGSVVVRWSVSSLSGIDGFNVYRGLSSDGPFELLNPTPLPAAAIGSFTDLSVWPETTFWYQLRAVLLDGVEDTVGSGLAYVTTDGELALRLSHARPNPTTGVAWFDFDIPAHIGPVSLGIYNVAGRLVRRMADGAVERGRHTCEWDGRDESGSPVSPGVYFARLEVGERSAVRRMVVLR
jgi:hypothetical protein